jgi:hypothetical protein
MSDGEVAGLETTRTNMFPSNDVIMFTSTFSEYLIAYDRWPLL